MSNTANTPTQHRTPQSFYHRPEWDGTYFALNFGGDTIRKLAWSGLCDRCEADLCNFLKYLMWVLSTRHGGNFGFVTYADGWHFAEDRFDHYFSFQIKVKRNGQPVASFFANADIKGRMTWSFAIYTDDGDEACRTEEFDLCAPSDVNEATEEIVANIVISKRKQPNRSTTPEH